MWPQMKWKFLNSLQPLPQAERKKKRNGMKSSLWADDFPDKCGLCHDTKYGYETAVDERFQLETSQSAMAQGRDIRNANWRVLGGHFCATHADHEIVCSIPLSVRVVSELLLDLKWEKWGMRLAPSRHSFHYYVVAVAGY